MRDKANKRIAVIALLAFACMVVGCKDNINANISGLTIDKSLGIKSTIVVSFDESLYDVSELKNMMDQEADNYNVQNGANLVIAGDAKVEAGQVYAQMDYASAQDYSEFNHRTFSIKKISDMPDGFGINVAMKDVKDGSIVNLSSGEIEDNLYLITTDEQGSITTPGKIMYISDGIEMSKSKTAIVTENMDGLAYIIFIFK